MNIKILCTLTFISMYAASCKKESKVSPVVDTSKQSTTVSNDKVTFYVNGGEKKINLNSIQKQKNSIRVGINETTCYFFEKEADFILWTEKTENDAALMVVQTGVFNLNCLICF